MSPKIKHDSLQGILDFIKSTHPHLESRKGVYCLKLWREPDGTRIPLEIMHGVRIKSFTIYNESTVIIQQHSHGMEFKNKFSHSFDATLYLPDLAMINVYDYSAEFLTNFGIDFIYLDQTKEAKIVMLAEWIHDIPKNLRAQWFRDEETERLLSGIGIGRKLLRPTSVGRHLDLED